MYLQGLKVIQHHLAIDVCFEYCVVRNPIQKRRKQWRVIKRRIEKPTCWIVSGVAYMHPTLYKKMKGDV